MNRIVREHYPAAKLPDDLRGELGLEAHVTVTIEESSREPRAKARAAALASLLEHRRMLKPSAADAVERVRELRDEWDR